MLKKTFVSLEKIRDYQLEIRKKELADSNLILTKKIDEKERTLKLIAKEKDVISNESSVNFNHESWIKLMKETIQKQNQNIIDAKQEVAAIEILLQNAWREKKSITVLLERIEKRQTKLRLKIEQLQLDEFGIIKFANKQQNNPL